jgi:IclR family transcriptional regulator, KDG regulon repressor
MDTTVVKGFKVLETLAQAEGPLSLAQLTVELGLQKSNVHRLLGTLTHLGYVDQELGTGRYRAGLRLWEVGTGVLNAHPLRRAATPYMHQLHRETKETISLTILDGRDVLYIDKLLSPRPLRFTTQPGTRLPALLNPSGLAMISVLPDWRDWVREAIGEDPRTASLDLGETLLQLEGVGRQGYALRESKTTPGLTAVAAPIRARSGAAAGALTVSGPAQRFSTDARNEAVASLLNVCALIAQAAAL